jgi:hypothetical protein
MAYLDEITVLVEQDKRCPLLMNNAMGLSKKLIQAVTGLRMEIVWHIYNSVTYIVHTD